MSTEKQTKASPYPLRAFWVRPVAAESYADAFSVRAVVVLRRPVDGFATIEFREGSTLARRHVNITELASTAAGAAPSIEAQLSALAARPLLSPVAGMTAAGADSSADDGIAHPEANSAREHAALMQEAGR